MENQNFDQFLMLVFKGLSNKEQERAGHSPGGHIAMQKGVFKSIVQGE